MMTFTLGRTIIATATAAAMIIIVTPPCVVGQPPPPSPLQNYYCLKQTNYNNNDAATTDLCAAGQESDVFYAPVGSSYDDSCGTYQHDGSMDGANIFTIDVVSFGLAYLGRRLFALMFIDSCRRLLSSTSPPPTTSHYHYNVHEQTEIVALDNDDDDDRTTMAATASYCDPMTGWLQTEMVVGIDDCATPKDDAAVTWTQTVTYHTTKCFDLGNGQSVIFECLLGSCPGGARTTSTTNDDETNDQDEENGNDEAVSPIMMGQRRRRGLRLADPAPLAARALTVRLMMHRGRGRSLAHND
jgi:hypothetical protein